MNRKRFLTTVVGGGAASVFCGAAPCCLAAQAIQPDPEKAAMQTRAKFTEDWVKRLMDVVDTQLQPAARQKFMESCGRACFASRHEARPAKTDPHALEQLLAGLKKWTGEDGLQRKGRTIDFTYGRPPGAKEARCLCPVVESGPAGLSGTYCQCSAGYVKEMFERATGKPVEVELVESLKRGGKKCRFLIHI